MEKITNRKQLFIPVNVISAVPGNPIFRGMLNVRDITAVAVASDEYIKAGGATCIYGLGGTMWVVSEGYDDIVAMIEAIPVEHD